MSLDRVDSLKKPSESRIVRAGRPLFAALISLTSIAWSMDLFRPLGIVLYNEQFLAGILSFSLALVYIHYPANRGTKRTRLPWYDALGALAGIAAGMYVAVLYPDMVERLMDKPIDALAVSVIIFILCLEGLRRSVGWALAVVLLVFVGYALLGHMGPGIIQTRYISFNRLFIYLALDNSALLGVALNIGATIVITFVFFGQLLLRSRGSDFFNDFAIALMGRYRGGSAKVAITASSLFGSISGISASNIMATGVVTIPLMKKAGYPGHVAAAIEAVASTGSSLVPPVMGAVAFLMAEILSISYTEVVIAAIIPALLYYVALFILADLEAARGGFQRVPQEMIPRLSKTLKSGWIFIAPFVVLVAGLFWLNLLPQKAAIYGAIAVMAVAFTFKYKGQRLTLKDVWKSLTETGLSVVGVIMIVTAAGLIMGVLNLSGLGFALTMALVEAGAGNVFYLLLLAAAICIVLGMGMPPVGVYVLLAVAVAPSLVEVGIPPLAAHMFIFYFGLMSMLTPPVAISAFFAANLANAPPMKTAFAAMRMGWPAYIVPFLFVFAPSLLLQGDFIQVLQAVATAIAGVWLVSAGFIGYFLSPLSIDRRVLFIIGGVMLLVPKGAVSWGLWSDIAGLVISVFVVALEIIRRRRTGPDRGDRG
ncbi:MAG: TRAP transporter fused permease subunit [Pseudomonadota bacterium]